MSLFYLIPQMVGRRDLGPSAPGVLASGGCFDGRGGRDPDRRDGRHGLDDLRPVHQRGDARRLLCPADRPDPPPRADDRASPLAEPAQSRMLGASGTNQLPETGGWKGKPYVRVEDTATGVVTVWRKDESARMGLSPTQTLTVLSDGKKLANGLPQGKGKGMTDLAPVGRVLQLPDGRTQTGPLGPLSYLSTLQESEIELWGSDKIRDEDGSETTVYYPKPTKGRDVLVSGASPTFKGVRSSAKLTDKLDFFSLMLALFGGTASLPHILIRYYTVKDQTAARRSTVVGIAVIGFFYILTLYLGLGAMTGGALDVTNSNMAALLARTFGELPFAVISAVAFTTVLGTVSGLILAASGAVARPDGQRPRDQDDRPR